MKTSVEIDENKVKIAKKIGGISTLRALIDLALDAYIARARRLSMAEMLGTGFFSGSLGKMRSERVRTRR